MNVYRPVQGCLGSTPLNISNVTHKDGVYAKEIANFVGVHQGSVHLDSKFQKDITWSPRFQQIGEFCHSGQDNMEFGKHGDHVEHGKDGKHQPDDL